MKTLKKGFTLIELLAVIVILAVIAVIVTPIVTKIIGSAKVSANARSVEGHMSNINYAITTASFTSASDLTSYDGEVSDLSLTMPSNDGIVCAKYVIKDGTVQSAKSCHMSDWSNYFCYEIGKGAYTCEATYNLYADGTAIYFNPVTGLECSESDYTSNTDKLGKTGCLKWYAYGDTENATSINLLLNHNTTQEIAWGQKVNGLYTPTTAFLNQIKTDTAGWVGVSARTDVYTYINPIQAQTTVTLDPLYKIDYTGYRARLITEDEINKIINQNLSCNTCSYQSCPLVANVETTYSLTPTTLGWLYDYTGDWDSDEHRCSGYGCNAYDSSLETQGYIVTLNDQDALTTTSEMGSIYYQGFYYNAYYSDTDYGIRPVITIDKSKLE